MRQDVPDDRGDIASPLAAKTAAMTASAAEPVAPADRSAPTTSVSDLGKRGHIGRTALGLMKTLLPLGVIGIGLAGYAYLKATRPEAPKQPQAERAFAVETVAVRRTSATPTLGLYGNTVAGRQVDIRALVAGRVVATHDDLREGGRIAAGETILAIDPFDYTSSLDEAKAQRAETTARIAEQEASLEAERTSLKHARSQLELAKADVERAEQLVQRGNLPDRTRDDRKQILLQRQQAADQLANSIAIWEARLAQTRFSGERLDVTIERAKKRLSETKLEAPFDAYVTEVAAQVGRMVSINDKVSTLIDRNWIEAQFSLSDSQFGRIAARNPKLEGRKVKVRWTLGGETFAYDAEITRVASRITSTTGGIDVFARIADPSKPFPLRPGAFVEITIDDITFDDVVRLPSSALYDGGTVYAVVEGRLDPRGVKLIGTSGGDILVRGPLEDGERVVTTRISTPGKGVLVKEAGKP